MNSSFPRTGALHFIERIYHECSHARRYIFSGRIISVIQDKRERVDERSEDPEDPLAKWGGTCGGRTLYQSIRQAIYQENSKNRDKFTAGTPDHGGHDKHPTNCEALQYNLDNASRSLPLPSERIQNHSFPRKSTPLFAGRQATAQRVIHCDAKPPNISFPNAAHLNILFGSLAYIIFTLCDAISCSVTTFFIAKRYPCRLRQELDDSCASWHGF